jgi:hypothetical protein
MFPHRLPLSVQIFNGRQRLAQIKALVRGIYLLLG